MTWTGDLPIKCAGCEFGHDMCQTQVATTRLLHELGTALESHDPAERARALGLYRASL